MSAGAPFTLDVRRLERLPAGQRAQEYARVAQFHRKLERNPLWRYVPHEGELAFKRSHRLPVDGSEERGQVAYHECSGNHVPTAALVGGNRAGKTRGGVADNLIQTLPPQFVPPWLLPYKRWNLDGEPFYCRVVGPDLSRWLERAMLPTVKSMVPSEALFKGSWDKAYSSRSQQLLFADGSWWDFLTHDMDVDAFAGVPLHRVHFDEEPEGEIGRRQYEESLVRLIDYDGDLRWTLTPVLGLTFVYYELTDERTDLPRKDPDVFVVQVDMDHNPHLSDAGRDRALKKLGKDPLKLESRKKGRWVHVEGIVYPEFNEHRHVVPDRRPAKPHVGERSLEPVFVGIDPGINKDHPAAVLYSLLVWERNAQEELVDKLVVFRTWKNPDAIVADVAKFIHGTNEEFGITPRAYIIDPSAQNRHHQTGRSTQWAYQQHGIWTMLGQNARLAGFDAVKERLSTDRLEVCASCDDLIREFREYRWKGRRNSKSPDAPAPAPIEINDHLLDDLRYVTMHLLSAPKPNEDEAGVEESDAQRAFRMSVRRRSHSSPRIGGVIPA